MRFHFNGYILWKLHKTTSKIEMKNCVTLDFGGFRIGNEWLLWFWWPNRCEFCVFRVIITFQHMSFVSFFVCFYFIMGVLNGSLDLFWVRVYRIRNGGFLDLGITTCSNDPPLSLYRKEEACGTSWSNIHLSSSGEVWKVLKKLKNVHISLH